MQLPDQELFKECLLTVPRQQNFSACRSILEQKIKDTLGSYGQWNLSMDDEDKDKQTILFHYPRLMNYGMGYPYH